MPTTAGEYEQRVRGLKTGCTTSRADDCVELARLANDAFFVPSSGFRHEPDRELARWAGQRAAELLEAECSKGPAVRCFDLSQLFRPQGPLADQERHRTTLEAGCHRGSAPCCHERSKLIRFISPTRAAPGGAGNRSLASLEWAVAACGLDETYCTELPDTLVGASIVDDAPAPPAMKPSWSSTLADTSRFPARLEVRRTIAFALALTWEQDRVRALETLDRLERPSRKRERIFKGWVEALAADGFRPERVRAAAQALLTEFETRQDGRPRPEMIGPDLTNEDPTAFVARVTALAARNAPSTK